MLKGRMTGSSVPGAEQSQGRILQALITVTSSINLYGYLYNLQALNQSRKMPGLVNCLFFLHYSIVSKAMRLLGSLSHSSFYLCQLWSFEGQS